MRACHPTVVGIRVFKNKNDPWFLDLGLKLQIETIVLTLLENGMAYEASHTNFGAHLEHLL